MNPLLEPRAIEKFLGRFSHRNQRRGRLNFEQRAVLRMSCPKYHSEYAAVVRGSTDYEVHFVFDPATQQWDAKCSCSLESFCQHAYAGMLALRANAAQFCPPVKANPPTVAVKPAQPPTAASTTAPAGAPALDVPSNAGTLKVAPKRKQAPAPVVQRSQPPEPPEPPEPPPTPLVTALKQALGRRLNLTEVYWVDRVQWFYREARSGRTLRAEALRALAPGLNDRSWTALELWRELPKDDLQCWLFCAWELRRRGVAIPPALQPVTNFSSIEAGMKAWEREKSIQTWGVQLARLPKESRYGVELIDLRIMILAESAQVQWKEEDEEEFKELKVAHLHRLIDEFQSGLVALEPEAMPLWLAIHQPFDAFTICNLEFSRGETAKLLGRVLRLPHIHERIVTVDGTPLARPAEWLRYELQSAQDESDDYQVRLLLADGTPAPPVLLILPGRPPLYLTERALLQGPPPHGFDSSGLLRIPAPALESVAGVMFLDSLKLELPPRLAQRTRRIPLQVELSGELQPLYEGSSTQAVFLRATAKIQGAPSERCEPLGWASSKGNGSKPRKESNPVGNGLIPLVDRTVQRHFPELFEELRAKWDTNQAAWRVRVTKNFPERFLPWLESVPKEVEVRLDAQLATLRDQPVSGSVSLEVAEAGVDWFDLKVALNVSETQLTQEELKLLLNAKGRFVQLPQKGWRRLQFTLTEHDDEQLARLGLNARDFTAEPQRLHALQLADQAARKFLPEQQVDKIHRRAAELVARVAPALPQNMRAELRPYQTEGFHFLAYLTTNSFGGVLADDMGLGKTLQTLTWLEWLRQTNPGQPSLVVCPKSVMDNWRAEAERFCPSLRVRLWRGEEQGELEAARAAFDLIVLNYSQLRLLSPGIAQLRWQAAILDEAQNIKNPDSQTAQAARALQAGHRVALTGTPIENRLLDLWSIFAFAMPGVLGNRAQFVRSYNQEDDPFARSRLAARVRPFLLRRTKGQVAQDLPDRVEEDIACEMEGEQKTLYRAEFKRAQHLLLNVTTQKELNEQRFHFLTSLLRLRQICCHPALVSEELQKAESAKLNALIDLLEPLIEGGHKVLVFSQFVTMLDILRGAMKQREWPHYYLAGDTENRGELVASFQSTPGAAVFLISLKAGGFGLNLTAASYVVLFDPWWNPAVEMQAIDRTHRIGQTSKVMAYRLLMKDSIEQKIRQLQRTKAALAEDVLGEEKFSQSLTLDDLRFLFAEE